MKQRWIVAAEDADEKQEMRFENWLSAKGIPFTRPETERDYRDRVTLLKDAIQLKKPPQRVPICPSAGFFPIEYAGATMYDAMYDYEVLTRAWEKYCHDFRPDGYNPPTSIVPGRVLDVLDFKLYQWPGHGLSKEREY